MRLIDSHCHLDADAFAPDRADVIARAQAAGVAVQIVPAVTAASWPKLRDVCAAAAGLYPAYGLHPLFLQQHRPEHLNALGDWIARERPCAIGECGLDFFVEGLDAAEQQRYFLGQLQLAREFDLPLIVHARRAVDAVILAIRKVGRLRGVVHSFAGSAEQAQQLHKLDFLIGLGGPVTYARAQRLRRLAAELPLQQLLLETDAPDQPDASIRGQRNEPARLRTVLDAIAALRGQPAAQIAAQTTRNAQQLFGLQAPATQPA
ncbi:TatD family deoxyribonuclease [Xanthomonas hyacinthi]|uniref:TatD family deoxyribonuclease n=1 Tax=Xanthomonas hyacinthi TaxID=56455 RepID=A0A2S7F1D1_9XANT|nr:TatD family hydrolase [Xanthomonas hyacinthi]KLD76866.1 DNAase [Xanthomonas hyacinthi DSM 19077]PPU99230.1 TatD family deoxyribonuclease [Xanthomonas hyacinthi]QGY78214.1 TatD family deoxyribonuclease [Xanthomonas hyacinthi]